MESVNSLACDLRLGTPVAGAGKVEGDLIRELAHDARGAISAVRLRAQMLRAGVRGPLSAEILADCGKMEAKLHSLTALVDDLAALARSPIPAHAHAVTDAAEVIANLLVTATSEPPPELAHLTLAFKDMCAGQGHGVNVDGPWLQELLLRLLSAAGSVVAHGTHVQIGLQRSGDHWMLSIEGPSAVTQPFASADANLPLCERLRGTAQGVRSALIAVGLVEAYPGGQLTCAASDADAGASLREQTADRAVICCRFPLPSREPDQLKRSR